MQAEAKTSLMKCYQGSPALRGGVGLGPGDLPTSGVLERAHTGPESQLYASLPSNMFNDVT